MRIISPLARSLGRRFLGRGKPKTTEFWQGQYRSGCWDRLGSEHEQPRYTLLASLIRRFAPPGSAVLEAGCGTGILAGHLAGSGLRYTGFDLAGAAIDEARERRGGEGDFFVGNADACPPDRARSGGPYGAIVFNEVVYYFGDPAATMAGYEPLLAEGGVFAVSVWNPDRWSAMLRRIEKRQETRLALRVGPEGRKPWRISILAPRIRTAGVGSTAG